MALFVVPITQTVYVAVALSPFNVAVNVKVTIVSVSVGVTTPVEEITCSLEEAQENATSLPGTPSGNTIEVTPFLIVPSIATELIALLIIAELEMLPVYFKVSVRKWYLGNTFL